MASQQKITTQEFVAVDEIREGIIMLKNGGIRAILMCSSRNFELEPIDSQNAIISAYADFINSFDWPIQIIIHSRKLDINPYLTNLEEKLKTQENELLKIQTAEYINFIKSFVTLTDIMVKRFYISVPFYPIESQTEGPIEKITSFLPRVRQKNIISEEKFKEYQRQLLQRVEHTILTLAHIGIKASQLQTGELVELFYNLYNPEELEKKFSSAQAA